MNWFGGIGGNPYAQGIIQNNTRDTLFSGSNHFSLAHIPSNRPIQNPFATVRPSNSGCANRFAASTTLSANPFAVPSSFFSLMKLSVICRKLSSARWRSSSLSCSHTHTPPPLLPPRIPTHFCTMFDTPAEYNWMMMMMMILIKIIMIILMLHLTLNLVLQEQNPLPSPYRQAFYEDRLTILMI